MRIYCEDCKHYSPYTMETHDGCYAVVKGRDYKSADSIIRMLPEIRNKENDCYWYKKR